MVKNAIRFLESLKLYKVNNTLRTFIENTTRLWKTKLPQMCNIRNVLCTVLNLTQPNNQQVWLWMATWYMDEITLCAMNDWDIDLLIYSKDIAMSFGQQNCWAVRPLCVEGNAVNCGRQFTQRNCTQRREISRCWRELKVPWNRQMATMKRTPRKRQSKASSEK